MRILGEGTLIGLLRRFIDIYGAITIETAERIIRGLIDAGYSAALVETARKILSSHMTELMRPVLVSELAGLSEISETLQEQAGVDIGLRTSKMSGILGLPPGFRFGIRVYIPAEMSKNLEKSLRDEVRQAGAAILREEMPERIKKNLKASFSQARNLEGDLLLARKMQAYSGKEWAELSEKYKRWKTKTARRRRAGKEVAPRPWEVVKRKKGEAKAFGRERKPRYIMTGKLTGAMYDALVGKLKTAISWMTVRGGIAFLLEASPDLPHGLALRTNVFYFGRKRWRPQPPRPFTLLTERDLVDFSGIVEEGVRRALGFTLKGPEVLTRLAAYPLRKMTTAELREA